MAQRAPLLLLEAAQGTAGEDRVPGSDGAGSRRGGEGRLHRLGTRRVPAAEPRRTGRGSPPIAGPLDHRKGRPPVSRAAVGFRGPAWRADGGRSRAAGRTSRRTQTAPVV